MRRPSAEQALNHPWLMGGSGACARYCLSSKDCGEAARRLQSKYPSMNDIDSPSSIQSTSDYVESDELMGPATPQSFREQCSSAARRRRWTRSGRASPSESNSAASACRRQCRSERRLRSAAARVNNAAPVYTHSDLETKKEAVYGAGVGTYLGHLIANCRV